MKNRLFKCHLNIKLRAQSHFSFDSWFRHPSDPTCRRQHHICTYPYKPYCHYQSIFTKSNLFNIQKFAASEKYQQLTKCYRMPLLYEQIAISYQKIIIKIGLIHCWWLTASDGNNDVQRKEDDDDHIATSQIWSTQKSKITKNYI